MTARAAIRQPDLARLMRAARREGVGLEIDMARGVARVLPAPAPLIDAAAIPRHFSALAPDGEENFGED